MITQKPPFDFFFMTYDEPKAEEYWELLKRSIPTAKRIHGIEGIARAWVEAGKQAETDHFFTMDGDSLLKEDFDFHIEHFEGTEDQRVHVYRCQNYVNGLVYGYGSIHLFPTQLVRSFKNLEVVDFTLSVATGGFCIQHEIASVTRFNTSPYISWKSGFREASKLASKTNAAVGGTPDKRTYNRLKAWCSLGRDVEYGKWCILGARMGALWGMEFANRPEKLALISDHDWFQGQFYSITENNLEIQLKNSREKLIEKNFICEEIGSKESERIKFFMSEA